MPAAQHTLNLARRLGILRSKDLAPHGIARTYLRRLCEQGRLRRVGRGLYATADGPRSPQDTLAVIARRVPDAVVCLLSALRIHDLTTQSPFEVWIAIPRRARTPKLDDVPVRVVRMAPDVLAAGVVAVKIDGVAVPVFDLEKTVVDCFRFRSRIGLDVALEALREYVRQPQRRLERLLRYAQIGRVRKSIQPYLEALL
ncbi:MAG: AbiEi antitoxin N-terminal domain-containing protein [Phycisphaerales bacterium]|nr:AbiEi antitoxin N-terminal domain-containing protein [Phycisphaerales bacterium]